MRLSMFRCLVGLLVLAGAGLLYRAVPPAQPGPAVGRTAVRAAPDAPATPTSEVPPAPAPRWSGAGEGETDAQWLEPGLVRFTIDHPSATPFAVFLLGADGEHLALLANDLKPVRGEQVFGVRRAGNYHLHVIAQDSWAVDVARWPETAARAPTALSGAGLAALGPLSLPAGELPFAWSHGGAMGLTAVLWSVDGRERIELAQSLQGTAGAGGATIPRSTGYVLAVQADGPWEFDLSLSR